MPGAARGLGGGPGGGPRGPDRSGDDAKARRARDAGERIAGLDGLRALAVVAVLVFHLRAASLPGGFLGVDVFFVVSGFLITTLLLREVAATGRIRLGDFWLRRARRLLPALAVVVAVSVSAAWLVGGDLLVDIDRQVAGALTFSTNWREIAAGSSYFTHTAPLLFATFWSLAVEEQFYLLWPFVLVLLLAMLPSRRRRVGVVLALAAASALAMALLVVPGQDPTRVYYGTDTHAFGLMIGAALALAVDGRVRSGRESSGSALGARSALGRLADGGPVDGAPGPALWRRLRAPAGFAGLAILALLAMTLRDDVTFTYRGGILLASLATALVIAALLGPRGPLSAMLETNVLTWLGRRSYGIYLWHWPVVLVLGALLPARSPDSVVAWVSRALALAATLALAAASYRLVEEPVRRLGFRECAERARAALARPWPSSRTPRVAGGIAGVLAVATVAAVLTAPDKSATQEAIEAGEAALEGTAAAEVAQPFARDLTMPTGEEITAFGDSMIVTSLGGLKARFPGIDIDAKSIRQWPEGAEGVERALAAGTVRRAVVLAYGTNAGVQDPALVRGVIRALGPKRMIVLVSIYQSSHWVPETNATLAAIAEEHDNVALADWHAAISARTDLLQADAVHPGIEGGQLFADVIAQAFASLAASDDVAADGEMAADGGAATDGGTAAGGESSGSGTPSADPPARTGQAIPASVVVGP